MTAFRYKHGDRPLEGYTVQRAVGRGGFGEVYYALSDSGREVALKIIQGYEQIELRGVSACMNLKSPHLITIFDVKHNADGDPFVIMEYVSGPSLRELIDQCPAGVGTQKAAFFLREIAKGLTYLHDQGIVHRDLKPGNIFYEDGYVKIGDYGLSKAMSASVHSGQTVTVGTVHYMAPEIGQGRYDRGVDIYALGVVLYEMLTGQTPYLGASPGEVLMKHLAGEPDLTGIEEPFATVVRRAMAKNPTDRYQSAQEMVEAVFGAEHVRNSVSVFRPESLSMVAERIGQKVTAGGPGSSAEHTGARLGQPAPGPDPAGGTGEGWDEFGRRMDEFGRRMGQWGEQFGERMAQVGTRLSDRLSGRPTPPPPPPPLTPLLQPKRVADPARDPLDWNQRRLLGVLTAAIVAGGSGILASSMGSANPLWLPLFAFVAIMGAAGGVIVAQAKFAAKLAGESSFVQRLAFGGTAAVAGLLCTMPCLFAAQKSGMGESPVWFIAFNPVIIGALGVVVVLRTKQLKSGERHRPDFGRLIYIAPLVVAMLLPLTGLLGPFGSRSSASWILQTTLLATLLSTGVALFLVNWRRHVAAGRPERLSLGAAFWAGLIAWIAATILDGNATLAGGIMAGVALVSQVLAPFDPSAHHSLAAASTATGQAAWSPTADRAVHQAPQPAPATHDKRLSPPPPPPPAADTFGGRVLAGQPHHPAGYGAHMLPSWARGLFLLAFALLSGTGLMLFCFAGIARLSSDEVAIAVAAGLGACMFALFCLVRAVKNTYRSAWSSFIRPVLLMLCALTALTSLCFIASISRLSDDEMLIGLGFIIFPSILFIVLACIPDRTVSNLSANAVALATPPYVPNAQGASARLRLWALLLACVGFFCPLCGLHRFYVGKVGTGLIWLFTLGFLGVGTLIDVIMIIAGSFTDRHGLRLLAWQSLDELGKYPASAHPVPHAPTPVPPPTPGPTIEPAAPAAPVPPEIWPQQALATGLAPLPQPARLQTSPRPRGLTNPLLAVISGLVLLAGLAVSFLAAIDLPALIAAGFPDPSLATQLTRDFGNYTGWPNLMERAFVAVACGIMVFAMLLTLIARRRAGAAHVGRVILAYTAFLGCFRALTDVMGAVNWPPIVDMFNHERVGPAIETALGQMGRAQDWMMCGGLLLAGLILLGWPESRRKTHPVPGDRSEEALS
ncbi:MAG: protein kinase [Phycisphaerae bacterium]|nr:protein kinase [Phycisphaerae bacterium]